MPEINQKPGFVGLRFRIGKLALRDRDDLVVRDAQTQGQSLKLYQRNTSDEAVLNAIDVSFPILPRERALTRASERFLSCRSRRT